MSPQPTADFVKVVRERIRLKHGEPDGRKLVGWSSPGLQRRLDDDLERALVKLEEYAGCLRNPEADEILPDDLVAAADAHDALVFGMQKKRWRELIAALPIQALTRGQALLLSAYTGTVCCSFTDIHAYIEVVMGRPVYTHEMASEAFNDELRKRLRPQFMALCRDVMPEGVQ